MQSSFPNKVMERPIADADDHELVRVAALGIELDLGQQRQRPSHDLIEMDRNLPGVPHHLLVFDPEYLKQFKTSGHRETILEQRHNAFKR